jgi:hypothetical protein
VSAPTTADTRQFTPNDIAIAVAKRIARVGDFDENWSRAVAERGIELAEDGAFTITTEGGQTFHLAVTQVASLAPVYATTVAAPDLKRQVLATHAACDLGHAEARHPSYLLHIPDCYDEANDSVWECGDEVTVDPLADPQAAVLSPQYSPAPSGGAR